MFNIIIENSSSTSSTTIGELNTAMLQAGLSPYSSQTAYIRIEQGSAMSNVISFTVAMDILTI